MTLIDWINCFRSIFNRQSSLLPIRQHVKKTADKLLQFLYNVCLEKGSDDIGSAVCDSIYIIYLFRYTQTADPISSEPF